MKVLKKYFIAYITRNVKTTEEAKDELQTIETDLVNFEKDKIKGAVRTDLFFRLKLW